MCLHESILPYLAPAALSDYDTYEYKSKQKRSIRDTGRTEEGEESLPDRITRMVLPSLVVNYTFLVFILLIKSLIFYSVDSHQNVVAHARDGNIPLNCTHHEVCRASNIFMKELGSDGHLVGYRLRCRPPCLCMKPS